MAEKNAKESTPPPLLLMPVGGGLTLNPPEQPSCLMPVVQSEPPLLDEDCEADSFVGQGDSSAASFSGGGSSVPFFQPGGGAAVTDPFAHVGHFAPPPGSNVGGRGSPFSGGSQGSIPVSSGSGGVAPSWAPASAPSQNVFHQQTTPSTENSSSNIYRQKGPMKYAKPPSGTYASSPPPTDPPATSPFGVPPPPTGYAPPPTGYAPPPTGYAPSPFTTPSSNSGASVGGVSGGPGQGAPAMYKAGPPPPGLPGRYEAVQHHWCYRKAVEGQPVWYTFSTLDSTRLEQQFIKEHQGGSPELISTDGGRYDVNIASRTRRPVYWEEEAAHIQRCSWFYKREGDNRYVPYDETQAERLESEYKSAVEGNNWHKRIELADRDTVVMHNANVIVHFQACSQPDEWGNVQGDQMRPRVVKRGVEEFGTIEYGESTEVDHLVFVLHGIGDTCDVRFRNIVECVDDFRSIANGLIQTHFGPYAQSGHIHRVEFLPVHWHLAVHSEATGVDNRLKSITLPSTQKLRDFVNDTLLDILFYTSPAYCQVICDTVGQEMNRLFQIFLTRNSTFNGEVSVAGHSLGASILFDLLMHQQAPGMGLENSLDTASDTLDASDDLIDTLERESTEHEGDTSSSESELTLETVLERVGLTHKAAIFQQEQIDLESLSMCSEQDLKDLGIPMGPRKKLQLLLHEQKTKKEEERVKEIERKVRKEFEQKLKVEDPRIAQPASNPHSSQSSISVDFICGVAGTGQPSVRYPQLEFSPSCLFALGSPIGVFLSVRGVQQVSDTFKLPTCPRFFNVFHPLDPVAYRLEPLINPSWSSVKPVLVPHYKGRKRMHLELKESITRMGTDLKQKIMESLRSTWNSLNQFARAHRSEEASGSVGGLERAVDQQVSSVVEEMVQQQQQQQQQQQDDRSDTASVCSSHDDEVVGQLNEGRRVDYVLQEKPIESFNDYLFALASHGCYWTSEDTALLILKEIYSPLGMRPIMPGPDGTTPRPVMPPPKSAHPPHAGSCPPPLSALPPRMVSPMGGPPPSRSRDGTPPLAAANIRSHSPFSQPGSGGLPPPPPMSGFVPSSVLQ